MPRFAIIIALLLVVSFCLSPDAAAKSKSQVDGAELIGTMAPEFTGLAWVGGKPHTLKEFRGHPVVIRLWNRHCSMCKNTAPLLNDFYEKYSSRGLIVIGIHHKKTADPDTVKQVEEQAKDWHMVFPVAVDNDWKTVKSLWMHKDRAMTSATILIGKDGRIAWLHPGGTIAKGSPAATQLEHAVRRAL